TVNRDLRTDQIRTAIVPLPIAITHNSDGGAASRRFLFRQKRSAAGEGNAHDREIVRGAKSGKSAAGLALFTQADQGKVVTHDIGKHGVPFADVAVGRIGK